MANFMDDFNCMTLTPIPLSMHGAHIQKHLKLVHLECCHCIPCVSSFEQFNRLCAAVAITAVAVAVVVAVAAAILSFGMRSHRT